MPKKCEFWLAMNEDGDFVLDPDSEVDASQKLADDVGGLMTRVVKFTAWIEPPKTIEVEVKVPDEAGTVTAQAK